MRPRLLFIGHSHHQKTGSCEFFTDLLGAHYELDCRYDASWQAGLPLDLEAMDLARYATVVLWQQVNYALHPAVRCHPNVVLVPMYDCHANDPTGLDRFLDLNNLKFINFCRAQHEACERGGMNSLWVRFFPEPGRFRDGRDFRKLTGFFWPRRNEIRWAMVERLVAGGQVSEMLLHAVPDRGFPRTIPARRGGGKYRITVSDWFDRRDDFLRHLNRANIYFAPRLYEGIGMAFLEAMAMGMCVVAPDTPTMNETIVHEVNGLLYDPRDPAALDFSNAEELGARARQSVEAGHRDWLRAIPELLAFIEGQPGSGASQTAWSVAGVPALNDTNEPSTLRRVIVVEPPPPAATVTQQALPAEACGPLRRSGGLRSRGRFKRNSPERPLITVATVTRNAERELPGTLASIFGQSYDNIELLVIDGASTDNTLGVIQQYDAWIDEWVSEPDGGPYDAMNKAAQRAGGEWILFLNAGDWLVATDTLQWLVESAPAAADVIFGHHFYRQMDGTEVWHKANCFAWTHRQLRKGELSNAWVTGIPGHQATLTRTTLLRESGYDTARYRYAADHDFLLRMSAAGRTFHHSDRTVAVYCAGGFSWRNAPACMREQWDIAAKFGPRGAVDRFYRPRIAQLAKQERRPRLAYCRQWGPPQPGPGGCRRRLHQSGSVCCHGSHSGRHLLFFFAGSPARPVRLKIEWDGRLLHEAILSQRLRLFGPWLVVCREPHSVLGFQAAAETGDGVAGERPSAGPDRDDLSGHQGILVRSLTLLDSRPVGWLDFASEFSRAWLGVVFSRRMGARGLPTALSLTFLVKIYLVILKSGLFWPKYYRRQDPEGGHRILGSALLDYILRGASERRDPNPLFDTGFYLDRNPDVAASGINPLYHYLVTGAGEGREPGPRVSMAEYVARHPELAESGENPLRHYLKRHPVALTVPFPDRAAPGPEPRPRTKTNQ